MSKERFYEIDLLRFLAALGVMFFHYTFRGFAADGMSPLEFPYQAQIFKYGSLGVDLFFIISGFVILLTAYNRDAISFTISRMTRIYPAYWFSVSLTAVAIYLFGGQLFHVELTQYLANLTMIHGYFGVRHVDGVYWSLLVELKFYFLVFLLIVFNQIRHIKFYLYAWLGVAYLDYFHPLSGAAAFFLIPNWATYFIAGAFFYLIRSQKPSFDKFLFVFLSYVLAVLNATRDLSEVSSHYNTEFSATTIGLIVTSFYVIFLLISLNKLRIINKAYFTVLGALTYPLYLIHQNIGFIVFNQFSDERIKYFTLALTMCLSLTLAYLINKYIEQRYGGMFKKFLYNAAYALPFAKKSV